MDLKRIYSYKEKTDKEINTRIKECRKQLGATVNQMARQEMVEEIRYLKKILNDRATDKPKKVNRIKNAPTVGMKTSTTAGSFRSNKVYI